MNQTVEPSPISAFYFGAAEMAIQLFLIPLSALNLSVIATTSVLHANLKFLLLYQSISIFISATGRLAEITAQFAVQDMFAYPLASSGGFIRIFGNAVNVQTGVTLVVERAYATLRVKSYEHSKSVAFRVTAGIFIVGIVLPVALDPGIQNPTGNSSMGKHGTTGSTLATVYIGATITILALLVLGVLYFYNVKLYHSSSKGAGHNLSERYQLSENIRTTRQLIPVMILHTAINFQTYTGVLLRLYAISSSRASLGWSFSVQSFINAVLYFLIQLAVLNYHAVLKRRARKLLARLKQRFVGSSSASIHPSTSDIELDENGSSPATIPRDINGIALIVCNEAQAHFQMLDRYWV